MNNFCILVFEIHILLHQIEACTVYACVKSNGTQITTVEDEPKQLAAPIIHVIGSRYYAKGSWHISDQFVAGMGTRKGTNLALNMVH